MIMQTQPLDWNQRSRILYIPLTLFKRLLVFSSSSPVSSFSFFTSNKDGRSKGKRRRRRRRRCDGHGFLLVLHGRAARFSEASDPLSIPPNQRAFRTRSMGVAQGNNLSSLFAFLMKKMQHCSFGFFSDFLVWFESLWVDLVSDSIWVSSVFLCKICRFAKSVSDFIWSSSFVLP